MNCKRCQTELAEYVDGTLPPKVRSGLERHLAVCAACADWLAGECNARSRFTSMLAPALNRRALNPEIRARLVAAGRVPVNRASTFARVSRPRLRRLVAAAALLLVLLGGAACWQHLLFRTSAAPNGGGSALSAPPGASEWTNRQCANMLMACFSNAHLNLMVNNVVVRAKQ
ncbi:MAG: zf-HC2 domain-containing protein [Kiritimatiellae bacterium]|nr:zf-HC2 domain-containing protein [Kiritimatiellia bacterium]